MAHEHYLFVSGRLAEPLLRRVAGIARVPVEHGPRDLRQLPEFFGRKSDRSEGYRVSIESFSAAEIAAAVRECDLARRLVYHALRHRVLPVHIEPRQRKQSGCDEEEPTA